MNRRFSTQAANADVLGDDTPSSIPGGVPEAAGADPTHRDRRPDRAAKRESKSGRSPGAEVKPGKDINAAGFVKDKDAAKP
jgi:hypothetical protein